MDPLGKRTSVGQATVIGGLSTVLDFLKETRLRVYKRREIRPAARPDGQKCPAHPVATATDLLDAAFP
jgi:hypothetical protein